ncbi:MAG: helix-turn-helix domain-containing protein [candidate division WOR-3 bacterium]
MVYYGELYRQRKKQASMIGREKLVAIHAQTGSISATARRCKTSRNVVRKWVRRFEAEGLAGLGDRSRRPRHSPNRTPEAVQERILAERDKTGKGRKRLAWELALNEWTVRNVLRQHGRCRKRKLRHVLYPAVWAWDVRVPFTLAQVDVKDVLDKGALGTAKYTRYIRLGLPRYQWTFCEAKTRFWLLAYSYELNQSNGLLFVALVMAWVRSYGIQTEVNWQEDWGMEFGGDNAAKLLELDRQWYRPYGAVLRRAPKGRKGYQGRVERSHRTDDEEFYLSLLERIGSVGEFLEYAGRWQYYYNVRRPHFGHDMKGNTPLVQLRNKGVALPDTFACFPMVLLDQHAELV